MAIYENFPYTNTHELNLNWIINEVKKGNIKIDELESFVNEKIEYQDDFLQESIINLQNEIANNLQWIKDNIQSIVNETINTLIETGEMYIGLNYIAETEELNIVLSQEEV